MGGTILGVNNLKWRDAMAIMGRYFSDEERLTGWTESLPTKQIAVLQRPHKWRGSDAIELCKSLLNEIDQDCVTGALRATKQDPSALEKKPIFGKKSSSQPTLREEFLRGEAGSKKLVDTLIALANPGRAVAISIYNVSAQDFKKWLHLKGEIPSPHVQAWFNTVIPHTKHVHDMPDISASPTRPLQRSAAQDATILATLHSLGIEPPRN